VIPLEAIDAVGFIDIAINLEKELLAQRDVGGLRLAFRRRLAGQVSDALEVIAVDILGQLTLAELSLAPQLNIEQRGEVCRAALGGFGDFQEIEISPEFVIPETLAASFGFGCFPSRAFPLSFTKGASFLLFIKVHHRRGIGFLEILREHELLADVVEGRQDQLC